jgi:hypothetical protein
MKAEEVLNKIANNHYYDSWEQLMYKISSSSQVIYFKEAIEEYTRIQIEKDRERVKANAKTKVISEFEVIVDLKSIDETPIILD